MNQKLAVSAGMLAVAFLWGCASARYEPPQVFSTSSPSFAPPALSLDETQLLDRATAQPPQPPAGEGWQSLFDGRALGKWAAVDFGSKTRVEVRPGLIYLAQGAPFNGIHLTNAPFTSNYELSLEAMRIAGSDFFCGLTFPVREDHCSLIVGGWGGGITGLSSIDGADASENETTQYLSYETGKWYRIRVRVTTEKIEAWIEQKKVANVTTVGRKVSLRFGEIELSKPLGITCWDTSAAFREIKVRPITTPDSPAEAP